MVGSVGRGGVGCEFILAAVLALMCQGGFLLAGEGLLLALRA